MADIASQTRRLVKSSIMRKAKYPYRLCRNFIDYVQRGFHVRMRGVDSGQINLIRPDEIELSNGVAVLKASVLPPSCPTASAATTSAEPMKMPADGLLPPRGRIACSRCFNGGKTIWGSTTYVRGDGWTIVNNPMAWGNRTPKVLVLGFSKGGNQNADILERPHDEVAFRGGRPNLSTIFETLGLKSRDQSIDRLISDRGGDFAFGSLVRCSVKKRDGEKWLMSGKDIMGSCLRDRQMGAVINNCISQFLGALPASVRLVAMLGNDLKYIEGCYSAIRAERSGLRRINAVSYGDEKVVFIHAVHFKAQGALVPEWATGTPGRAKRPETDQPLKRKLAIEGASLAVK